MILQISDEILESCTELEARFPQSGIFLLQDNSLSLLGHKTNKKKM